MMPPNEPLSSEERQLAAQLDRLLPRGGPSPELDARILAASRAALEPTPARRAQPRWPVALGLAASMVVAVGIAWQLRLPQQDAMVASEAPPLEQAPAAAREASKPFPPAPEAVAPASPPVPLAATAEEASAGAGMPTSVESARSQDRTDGPSGAGTVRRQVPAAAGRPESGPAAPPGRAGPPPPAPPAPAAPAPPRQLAPSSVRPAAPPFAADPEPAITRQSGAFMPDRPIGTAAGEGGTTGAVAERYQSLSRTQAQRAAAGTPADSQAEAGAALDRIEVSGSRVRRTDLQVPVSADTLLEESEWIERIRTRQGIGDEDSARRSLALFVQAHSRARVPTDLLPLLAE